MKMEEDNFLNTALELNKLGWVAHESNNLEQAATLYAEALKGLEVHTEMETKPGFHLYHEKAMTRWNVMIDKHKNEAGSFAQDRNLLLMCGCHIARVISDIMRPIALAEPLSYSEDVVPAVLQHNMGVILFLTNQLDEAIEFLSRAEKAKIARDNNNLGIILSIHCALGITYARQENLDESLKSLARALTVQSKYNCSKNRRHASMLKKIGHVHGAMGNARLAYSFFLGEMLVSCEHQPTYAGFHVDGSLFASKMNITHNKVS